MSYPYTNVGSFSLMLYGYDISWSGQTSVGSFSLMLYDIHWSEQSSVGSFSLLLYGYDISWSEQTSVGSFSAQIRICHTHTALRRKSQHWFAQISVCHIA
jgi:hypothetical protein